MDRTFADRGGVKDDRPIITPNRNTTATPRLSIVERPGFFRMGQRWGYDLPSPRKLDGRGRDAVGASSVPATLCSKRPDPEPRFLTSAAHSQANCNASLLQVTLRPMQSKRRSSRNVRATSRTLPMSLDELARSGGPNAMIEQAERQAGDQEARFWLDVLTPCSSNATILRLKVESPEQK
jgi:hypothetical protein